MPQTNDQVIEVSLQAACIRAAATVYAGSRETLAQQEDVIEYARGLYFEATKAPWRRGDAS